MLLAQHIFAQSHCPQYTTMSLLLYTYLFLNNYLRLTLNYSLTMQSKYNLNSTALSVLPLLLIHSFTLFPCKKIPHARSLSNLTDWTVGRSPLHCQGIIEFSSSIFREETPGKTFTIPGMGYSQSFAKGTLLEGLRECTDTDTDHTQNHRSKQDFH